MKTKFLLIALFVSSYIFSQSVNDYVAVIIPVKYDFQNKENQYRLNTLTKVNLQKAGFEAYYSTEAVSSEYKDRCNLLNVDVVKENGFLITKLYVVFKDCYGKVVFKSEVGKSREKDYEAAYTEALSDAFVSVNALHYKYNGSTANKEKATAAIVDLPVRTTTVSATALTSTSSTTNEAFSLFAQPIKNGFQLIDSTPKVVMKVYNTTNPSVFLATKDNTQGVLLLKDNQWVFEYYDNEILMSEKIAVKF